MDENKIQNSLPFVNRPSYGPVFEAEPGWGGKLSSWVNLNLKTKILPFLAISTLAVGLFMYLANVKSKSAEMKLISENIAVSTEINTPLGKSTFNSQSRTYKQTATRGQGITHLARAALGAHLSLNLTSNLTKEHMVYIEDYLQNKTGDRFLEVGEVIEFSVADIEEAMSRSKKLKPEELKNLSKYVKGPRV